MAKKSAIAKQARREKLVKLKWEKRQALKNIIKDPNVDEEEKLKAINDLNKLSPNSSPVRLRNRCGVTGRARGFLRKFQLSRLTFREYALQGLIPGVTKSSW
uniref:Small ribosomal subunit protein uS14 n=1 Tax=uncultured bacterium W5-77b TaxID=1131000 RepID=H9BWF5_9BACT|nr:30S ribosomal protein S14 [uncultured bacterium W5-77b]